MPIGKSLVGLTVLKEHLRGVTSVQWILYNVKGFLLDFKTWLNAVNVP